MVKWAIILTQTLTGHGCFQNFLHKIKRIDNPSCLYCATRADNVEHRIFECENWTKYIEITESLTGDQLINSNNMISTVLNSKERWTVEVKMITNVLKENEEIERKKEKKMKRKLREKKGSRLI